MKIGIYGQFYHEDADISIQILLEALYNKKNTVFIEENFLKLIVKHTQINEKYTNFPTFKDLDTSFDLFFTIGGDGTILKSITYIKDLNIPLAGINTGRLGFLASIQKEEIKQSIEKILNGNYCISERNLLSIDVFPKNKKLNTLNFALNEISVIRKNTTSMIKVETFLNDEYLTSYWSDGLIISTPTGSTGYSLSCGGPILDPTSSSIILTPIAPHNLNARPIVIPDTTEVKLKVSGREKKYLVSLDSRIATLTNETCITIKKSPFTIKMIQLDDESFIKTLRKKLLWGEDKRN
ncbi:MAG: NAD kinase [Flavobacteriaceae bacterium CG2_30_34_30]|nr:MAG: NAD kinase [Flavobacteriaceae bacterium CG2_30_34_30]PIQ19240.1 MAG: NAD kinase [Flavobacteriaceae bacterium CG18_big_fil_WC_8_21_14_2_50_34_36]PIV48821.1 MAG: NAD kinase [Flavobacteriaceae bacterium CG02_land_8_20_14_3_00_34_13]PIZ08374.1 MAG: NAD kinase [Flavobacteriaceae bacterium CG_4_10_14_0_8_um_filter_34_31]PJC06395.1 MAG: NAD kinase [Flavobacteriaceae bacterium CG_4_9_14_0_8_um_filter_34_30]